MVFNASDLVNQPWNTTFSPYVDLLSQSWYIIPVAFIGAALFMKTRDPVLLSMYMITTGALFTAGGIFVNNMAMVPVFAIFAGLGFAVLLFNLFFGGR